MWRIVKQSDRATMIDELSRLSPLTDPMDLEQRGRAVQFVVSELQFGNGDNASINLNGDWVDENNNYLSIIIGARPKVPDWSIVKSDERELLITHLAALTLTHVSDQQDRAVSFALNELRDTDEKFGSVNMSGGPDFLSLSVSAAN